MGSYSMGTQLLRETTSLTYGKMDLRNFNHWGMGQMTLKLRWGKSIGLVVLLGFGLTSCDKDKPYTIESIDYGQPQAPAEIKLSGPKVYARETLINDRRAEVEYLQALLKETVLDPALLADGDRGDFRVRFQPQLLSEIRSTPPRVRRRSSKPPSLRCKPNWLSRNWKRTSPASRKSSKAYRLPMHPKPPYRPRKTSRFRKTDQNRIWRASPRRNSSRSRIR